MTNPDTFDDLPIKARASLQKLSDLVVGIRPIDTKSWRFFTNGLSEQTAIINEVSQWASKGYIYLYIIELVAQPYNISDLKEAFSEAKNTKRNDRAYARLNSDNISVCLYVGSSRGLPGRLKQHLGYGHKDTFALQLAHWASTFDLELEIQCAKYQLGQSAAVYQILEDILWEQMSPMFGRKGMK